MPTLNTFLKLSRPMLIWSPTVVCFNTFQSDKRNHNKKKSSKSDQWLSRHCLWNFNHH